MKDDNHNDDKMLTVQVRFWTDELAKKPGAIAPKHAWDAGVVSLRAGQNRRHNVRSASPVPFNSLADLLGVIAKVLRQHGITLHPNRRTCKLYGLDFDAQTHSVKMN